MDRSGRPGRAVVEGAVRKVLRSLAPSRIHRTSAPGTNYPKGSVSKTRGTKGYSPACSNEWNQHLCDKRSVKCGECPNQAFIPVTKEANEIAVGWVEMPERVVSRTTARNQRKGR